MKNFKMHLRYAAAVALLCTTLPVVAQQQVIIDLEQRRFTAQVNKDEAVLREILSDDLIYTHSSGVVEDKKMFIANVLNRRWDYRDIKTEDQVVRLYGSKTAVVTGLAIMKVGEMNLRLRYTTTYIRRKGRWQMVVWLSTRLAS
jgi:Domain of unknown function (DUF4440)